MLKDRHFMSPVEKAFRPELQRFNPYKVPSSQGMVKLDAMENPFPLPPDIQNELAQQLAHVAVHRYPDASLANVKAGLRTLMLPPEQAEMVVGNGSDEILQLLILAAARPGAVIMGVEPSFVMYRLLSQWFGLQYVGVPLKEDFSLDSDAVLAAIQHYQPSILFLAYPNNPTGNTFNRPALEALIKAMPGLVVMDEAYYAFTDDSFLPAVLDFSNLVVVRTVSKLGMAGLRLGCVFGASQWVQPLEGIRLPYNINGLTQKAFEVLVKYHSIFTEQTTVIRSERESLYKALKRLPGVIKVWPSECNFLLIRVQDAPFVYEELKARGILIKLLHGAHPLLEHVLRVSIGSSAENEQFLLTLQTLFSK